MITNQKSEQLYRELLKRINEQVAAQPVPVRLSELSRIISQSLYPLSRIHHAHLRFRQRQSTSR